jgi:hypothetical protein
LQDEWEDVMRARKSSGLVSPDGAIRLMTHAMMGAALGLAFGLAIILVTPAVAALLEDGGSGAMFVFVVTLVTTFAIDATLTGALFIVSENNKES